MGWREKGDALAEAAEEVEWSNNGSGLAVPVPTATPSATAVAAALPLPPDPASPIAGKPTGTGAGSITTTGEFGMLPSDTALRRAGIAAAAGEDAPETGTVAVPDK